jgi:hypothetical protein
VKVNALDELLPPSNLESAGDAFVARSLSSFANRTSRRSFIAGVGRAGLAVMGGAFLSLWRMESAASVDCGVLHDATARLSCLCVDLIGSNNCPQCCGGYWTVCATSGPHTCPSDCGFGQTRYFRTRLYDCCNACTMCQQVVGCQGGNHTCCYGGYCSDNCGNKNVRCVRKVCTNSLCIPCS